MLDMTDPLIFKKKYLIMNDGFRGNSDCPYWRKKAISGIENTIENTEF